MKVLKEVTANSFINHVKLDRSRVGYGNQAIRQGFIFAFHQKFSHIGPEYFKSIKEDEIIDEELFILETASNTTFSLDETITLLARFFCGIQVFKDRENWSQNNLYDLLTLENLDKYVSDEMINSKIKYVKQVLEMS